MTNGEAFTRVAKEAAVTGMALEREAREAQSNETKAHLLTVIAVALAMLPSAITASAERIARAIEDHE